jgi:hypothetical protein
MSFYTKPVPSFARHVRGARKCNGPAKRRVDSRTVRLLCMFTWRTYDRLANTALDAKDF